EAALRQEHFRRQLVPPAVRRGIPVEQDAVARSQLVLVAQLQLGQAGQVGARDEDLHVLFRVDQLLQLLRDLRVLRRRRVVDDVDGRRPRRGGGGRGRLRGGGLRTQLRDDGVDEPPDAGVRQQRPSRREQFLRAPGPDAAPDGVDEETL